MSKLQIVTFVSLLLIVVASACTLPTGTEDNSIEDDVAVAATVQAMSVANAVEATLQAMAPEAILVAQPKTSAITSTPEPTSTPVPTVTPTPTPEPETIKIRTPRMGEFSPDLVKLEEYSALLADSTNDHLVRRDAVRAVQR
jgi:hypothetical protein